MKRPWLNSYAEGVPAEIELPDRPLTSLLEDSAGRWPDQVALDFFGATTTYAQLATQVAKAATALAGLGVRRGDRVALIMPNCPQHVVAFYAVLRLGAIVVEHNPLYPGDDMAVQLADCGAELAICWEQSLPTVLAIAERTAVRTIVAVDMVAALPTVKRLALRLPIPAARKLRAQMSGPVPPQVPHWEAIVAAADPLPVATPGPSVDDIALLQYTGGTTGTPKGAILTHSNLAANAAQGRAWVVGFNPGKETFLAALPLFHAYGLTLCLTFAINVGARLVLLPKFDVDMALAAIARTRPTFIPGVPPMYARLAAGAAERGTDLTSVRFAISGAMPLPVATVQAWESLTGGLLVEGYGMTEASPVALGNPVSPARRPGSIGVAFPSTEVRLVDPDQPTVDVAQGERGELVVRGPQVFTGYWNQPEASAETLLPGGWLRTGDIAIMDTDGYVTLVDRIKELIIIGGFNVYPSEVETVLCEHPDVADAAVVGVPDPTRGEVVVAAIIPAAGAEVDTEALRAWCRERMAAYKVPRRIAVVDDLPRSLIGKVMRRSVREQLLAEPDA